MNSLILHPHGTVTAQALSFTGMLVASDGFKIGSKKHYRFAIFFERINGQWYMQGTPHVSLLNSSVKPTTMERGSVYHEAYQIAESFWKDNHQLFVEAGIIAANAELERLAEKEQTAAQELQNIRNRIQNQLIERNDLIKRRAE